VPWIRGARGQRNRPAGGGESLTPTELRVTQLIAEGLTNPQIADRMLHVSHIFTKLDGRHPRELAAEAARRAAAQA